MGMDIYAGTLIRFYSDNWKTAMQQWCESNGMNYQRITPEEDNGETMSQEEIEETVVEWCDGMISALSNHFDTALPTWKEDNICLLYTSPSPRDCS